jgi:hypothetical protein
MRVRKAGSPLTASITDAATLAGGAEHPSPKYDPRVYQRRRYDEHLPPSDPENPMDNAYFFSHLMLWIVGAITALGLVGVVGAVFSMGRQGYRKN